MSDYSEDSLRQRRLRWRTQAHLIYAHISWVSKLLLQMGQRIYIRDEQLVPENKDNPTTPLYLFYCSGCEEPDIDYVHGFLRHNDRLDCSKCRRLLPVSAPQLVPEAA